MLVRMYVRTCYDTVLTVCTYVCVHFCMFVSCTYVCMYVSVVFTQLFLALRSAVNVAVQLNIPKFATSLSCDPLGSGERYEYKQQDKHFTWHLKKIPGGTSSECKIKVSRECFEG